VEEVQRRLKSGEFRSEQLAFVEGLSQWTPLATVLIHVKDPNQSPPYSPNSPPPFPTTPTFESSQLYAGFWLRAIAYIMDTMLIMGVVYGLFAILMLISDPQDFLRDLKSGNEDEADHTPFVVKLVIVPLFILGPILYFALMESSSIQGTLGKMALRLKVTDLQGRKLSFWHAFGRNAAKMVTNMTCFVFYVGYILAGMTAKKQALHDMIASTLVCRK